MPSGNLVLKIGFYEGFWIAGLGINACCGNKGGIGSLKERREGPKVGMRVGRAMAELTLGPAAM